MNLNSIPAFQDNYIWVLSDEQGKCLIVDPGEAAPVLKAIEENAWQPVAILLTHHHDDHTGGVKALLARYPDLIVYGPQETAGKGTTKIVHEGDAVVILGHEFSVIATPGHTLGHLSYFSFPYLFCGDTMFSAGCGRLFEGTPAQMYQSFQKLNQLPEETLICCAHEYTLSNLTFSVAILPEDMHLTQYYREVKELRAKNQKTLPSNLKKERQINLFLRVNDIDLINKINTETTLQHPEERFAWLRAKKDSF
ncbi:hydroxyacylglutathione hydrolase [Franconibacter sp. IITDAS19]|uniref:hydroxyacylglutathione hydrolase n=1 Tax=Franconibacter sp. IITDAS19 TaxID=2930569 RepID=UPI001FF78832|nr:hydroxyacylglutathione hydrolase [Franconibacter sp. IITDAS19]MCK1966780.1 hydroxyacylglutathione hydrolase [Franconibacter sp. IITDAS19]